MNEAFANRYFRVAVIYSLIGMSWGIFMGMSGDHSTFPAHAHLNLLGWVSMAIYGAVYRLCPSAAGGTLPRVHFWIANIGLIVMVPGIALIQYGDPLGEPLAIAGSLVTLLSMIVFAITVWRGALEGRAASG
ncbi:MAG: hypothetical protein O3A96_16940 [Proteobacteria bacterium]|nr:hypothetical protein [Pseudomonadota bacterium]